jgi:maltose alpha-D-glucosyltransferase/alpha-amylase
MQWSPARNGGFSSAPRSQLVLPVISRGAFGYRQVNVAAQHRDPGSLLTFVRRAFRVRRELGELTAGDWQPLRVREPSVVALRYKDGRSELLAIHNLASAAVRARGLGADGLVDAFANRDYAPAKRGGLELDGYGFRWLRSPEAY